MDPSALSQFTVLALKLLGVVLVPIATWAGIKLVRVVEQKTGIDIPERQENLMRMWIVQGIMYAEERARQAVKKKAAKITGPEKLEMATDFVMDMIQKYGLDKKAETWAREQVQKRVDAEVAKAKPGRSEPE